jgi:hypothetical protein
MLGVGGVGLFCGRVHLQTRETKGNQGRPRGNQGETKGRPKENQGETKGDQGKPKGDQGNKENPFNQQKKYLPINGSIFNQ